MIRMMLLALLAAPIAALAQGFPSKPIRMVVPYSPGGAADTAARATATKMSENMGHPVVVDNRPGATGIVGSEIVARAAPDGYTVILSASQHYMVTYFNKEVPYDPVKDFTPIGKVASAPAVLVVSPSLPVQTVSELIAYAKQHPGKLDYGTTGIGSMQHLGGLMLAQLTGIDIVHVPYKGGPPAMADLLSGSIAMGFLTASTVMPQAKAGKMKALGVIEGRRWPGLPGVPMVGESVPGYAVPETWFGLLGPAHMAPQIVAQLNAEVRKAIAAPEVRARLEGIGFEVTSSTAEEFAASVKKEIEVIHKIVTAAGIQPQ